MAFILAISAGATLTFTAIIWATWLDYRTSLRVLEMIDAAAKSGQAPAPELLARLDNTPTASPTLTHRATKRIAIVLLLIGLACFGTSALSHEVEQEQMLLQAATIAGVASLLCLAFNLFGRRFGL